MIGIEGLWCQQAEQRTASDFAWDAVGLIGYRFLLFSKENNAAIFAGYRALHQDYTDGSGDDKFKWDVTLDGPILGMNIGF